MHNPEIEDALGAAHSFLHALKMAIESCKTLEGGGRDYCALHLLADAAQGGINRAITAFDSLEVDYPHPVENHAVDKVDNGEK